MDEYFDRVVDYDDDEKYFDEDPDYWEPSDDDLEDFYNMDFNKE